MASKLPVFNYKESIIKAVLENDVVIVTGETGSGKTTQIPQYLLDSDELRSKFFLKKKKFRVVVTQPRRVAAMAMAERVSKERNVKLGEEVGYTIRFDDKSNREKTQIRYVTDGTLLRESLVSTNNRDKKSVRTDFLVEGLAKNNIIMLDEAHERSVHTDVLFGVCKLYLIKAERPPFRLIITSAVLDVKAFQAVFVGAPHIHVPTRMYPVDIFYKSLDLTTGEDRIREAASTSSWIERVKNCVYLAANLHENVEKEEEEIANEILEPSALEGDYEDRKIDDNAEEEKIEEEDETKSLPPLRHILVFLTGQDECESAVRLLHDEFVRRQREGSKLLDAVILPLYGSLPQKKQSQVFDEVGHDQRKIIFATNLAETSLTISGVGYVIDCGFLKQKIFNPKTGLDALQVVREARSQALQRTGRAGRTRKGKCFRLFSEKMFETLEPKAVPEIQRSNLAGVVLELKCLGIDNVFDFPFVDAPSKGALVLALRDLYLVGGVDADGSLTPDGSLMAKFPVDPSSSRCILDANVLGVLPDVVDLVSILSVDQVFFRPHSSMEEAQQQADAVRKNLTVPGSDHLTLLKIFEIFRDEGSISWCRKKFLRHRALQEAQDIQKQLDRVVRQLGFSFKRRLKKWSDPWKEAILKCLASGFYMRSGRFSDTASSWVTPLDGTFSRPEMMSAIYEEDGHVPEFVIARDITGRHESDALGSMRIVSGVPKSVIVELLKKIDSVNLMKLCRRKTQFNEDEDIAHETQNKRKLVIIDVEQSEKDRNLKLENIKKRYMERKIK
eukprot:GHVP01064783.1.p1 GENE.GHVP01064783.1~~GHVP01064783.1.p1  ORF type:complete len:786 (-),score=168.63 GHVP01064783.1:69-2426(-)